jgi:hypothetical protein
MGNLSNLYISQSYISLIHLGSDNTASTTMTELQDGLGNGTGISVNTLGAISASGLSVNNNINAHRGLEVSGTIKFNTAYTASTPSYVNSGNQFTDNIIRITGSYASGSLAYPTMNEANVGWIVNGPGVNNAVVTNKVFIPATGWEFTINQNTAVWFGNYSFTNPQTYYDNVSISGSEDITGSLWVRNNITTNTLSASSAISASDLWVANTIHAYKLDVTIESSSIIFTSGSNIIGDEANVDTQTLVGRVIVTGSLEVTGSTRINGNVSTTGSLNVTTDISSSTVNGIGNVTAYSTSVNSRTTLLEATASYLNTTFSTSVDARLDIVEATASLYVPFSTSVNSRLVNLENFSSSLVATFATVAQLNASSSTLQSNLNSSSSILQSNINTKLDTASFNSYSASTSILINTNSGSAWGAFQSASAYSASAASQSLFLSASNYATYTKINGSNAFSGSNTFTGSIRGNVVPLTIASNTASMDCSLGNFFTLTLPGGGVTTRLIPTNILPGETFSLKVTVGATTSSLSYPTTIKFPNFGQYSASLVPNAVDIVTFVTFDNSTIYGVNVKNMI